MHGSVDLRRPLELGTELRDSGMEASLRPGWDAPIQRVAEQFVAEVPQLARSGREEERLVNELEQRPIEVLGRDVHDPGKHVGDEAAPDDRRRPGSCLGLRRQALEAGEHRVFDRGGDGGVADRPAVDPGAIAKRPEQFLDVERDPVGPLVHRLDHVTRRRQPGIQDQRRHQGRLLDRQLLQAHLFGDALGHEARMPLAQEAPATELVGSVGADQEQRPLPAASGELADDLEAEIVGPLEVLEQQGDRLVGRREKPIDDVKHQSAATVLSSLLHLVTQVQQLAAELGEDRLAEHVASEVEEFGRRDVPILGGDVAPTDRKPAGRSLALDGIDEARLADARFAADQQHPAVAGCDFLDPLVGQLEDVVAPDEQRTEDRGDPLHGRTICSLCAVASVV